MATIKDILAGDQGYHAIEFADAFFELVLDREEPIPEALRDQVRICSRYKLTEMKKLVEMVYAAVVSESADCGPILLKLCARLAEWFDVHANLGMAGRGIPIQTVLLRAAGENVPALPEGTEPEPMAEFMPVAEVETEADLGADAVEAE